MTVKREEFQTSWGRMVRYIGPHNTYGVERDTFCRDSTEDTVYLVTRISVIGQGWAIGRFGTSDDAEQVAAFLASKRSI